MSARLGLTLGASVLVSSPVLLMLQQGTLSPAVALERWAICLAVCWLAITVVGALAFPDAMARKPVPGETDEPERVGADLP
jgi:hypothetical protein